MNEAQDVIDSLRSYPTVFSCECGGQLWHLDGDLDSKLTCERCTRYMTFGFTVKTPLAVLAKQLSTSHPHVDEPIQPELWETT